MPEEINRVLTDQLSDLLLTPSPDAEPNLLGEGIPRERIVHVGHVMIDSLHYAMRHPTDALQRHGQRQHGYAVVTLHRPSNVDSLAMLGATADAVAAVASRVPVLFPVHPRTVARAEKVGMMDRLRQIPHLS